ncbi:MAG: hypothetical protein Q9185_004063 [Variospora sp. 1 TL-2023]
MRKSIIACAALAVAAAAAAATQTLSVPTTQRRGRLQQGAPVLPLTGGSGSHHHIPKDPPGFGVIVDLALNEPIAAENVYLAALAAVHEWAFLGWKHVIPSRAPRGTVRASGVEVIYRTLAVQGQQSQLEIRYLIYGMLHLIDEMRKEGRYCVGTVSTFTARVPTGFIGMDNRPGPREVGDPLKNDTVPATISGNATSSEPQSLSARRRIVDPRDANFVITYERHGDAMSCIDFLSTALYAMATAAQGRNDEFCEDLAGFNEQRTGMYQLHGVDEARPRLTYENVRRAMLLLPARLFRDQAYGEVKYSFEYGGSVIGGGFIRLNDYGRSEAR